MIARVSTRYLSLFVALSMAIAMGCSDDPGTAENSGENQDPNAYANQNQTPPPPDDLDEHSELLYHGSCDNEETICTKTTTVGVQVGLSVQLINAEGDPIEGAMIGFELDTISGADAAALEAPSVITDADGVATAQLRAGDESEPQNAMGTVEVTARVIDDEDINQRVFNVGISPKNAAAYIIEFDHLGDSDPDVVQAFLLDPAIDCDRAVEHYLDEGFWPDDGNIDSPPLPLALPLVTVMNDGTIHEAMYPEVQNNDKFTVGAIADRESGTADVEVAYGCNDDAEPVEHGVDVRVEVPLVDHLPHLEERYEMTHSFDLTAALPESVQMVIDIISTLADSPAEFILGCPEEVTGCDGQWGLVDLLFESEFFSDFDIIDDIEDLRSSNSLFNLARDFLDGLIEDHLLDGLLPDWTTDAIVVADDLTDMLQSFEIRGPMFFNEPPELDHENGSAIGTFSDNDVPLTELTDAPAYQRWETIVFQWSRGCEESSDPEACAEVPVSAGDLGTTDAIVGQFGATVYGTDFIEIEQHALTLNYGMLLIGAIEQVALPNIFDESVTSISDMLEELVSCSGLAGAFSEEGDGLYNSVETMCHQLLSNATDAIYDYVEDLFVESDEHFLIATPAGEPCSIYEPDTYPPGSSWPGAPRPYIESIGQSDDEMRCEWATEVYYSGDEEGEPDAEIPGLFDGKLP